MPSTWSLKRRTLLALLAGSGAVFAQTAPTFPAFRPIRPVRILSPQQPGGSTDAVLRPLALRLSELWGQPVLVDNRPGGGSIIATQAVVQAPPDGHTLGLAINSLTINPSLREDLPYDTLRDLTPITQIASATIALVAHPSLGVSTVPEFVALAKAKPGTISWASLGMGTGGHITGELLRKRAGIEVVHVPFSGSSGAYRELLPGRVHAAFVVLDSALPHVQAGKLRLLAVCDPRRHPHFPQVPSLQESYPGLAYESLLGLVGPAGMPPELVQQLFTDIRGVLGEPALRGQLERQSLEVLASTPAEFAALLRSEIAHWRSAVKESGAQVN